MAVGGSVTLEYTGRLDDGTVFDTSRESVAEKTGLAEASPDREYTPLTVEVGAERVIEGMEEGPVGLEAGESTTLSIPPEKACGEPSDEKSGSTKPTSSGRRSARGRPARARTWRPRAANKAR